jgi:hypothetical protein
MTLGCGPMGGNVTGDNVARCTSSTQTHRLGCARARRGFPQAGRRDQRAGRSREVRQRKHRAVVPAARLRATIHRLAEVSALESGVRQGLARFLVRQIGEKAGVVPASINDLYMARGQAGCFVIQCILSRT